MTPNQARSAPTSAMSIELDVATTAGAFRLEAAFRADPGVTALSGPSGSGKSLTLATIAGLVRPERGVVHIDGRLVADAAHGIHVRSQDRSLGMVSQRRSLLPHRTALDNVALAMPSGRMRDRRREALEVLCRTHADHLAARTADSLSGGEQQRVALARAVARSPRGLLLDEPFSAVDRSTRQSLLELVAELVRDQRMAVVLVTHDLDHVANLAATVVRYRPVDDTTTIAVADDE